MKKRFLAAALFALAATPAAAYTSYLKPDSFWPEDNDVVVEGSYASVFFTPSIAVPAELVALNPSGENEPFDNIRVDGALTQLDITLPVGGTYRFSTGEQLGEVTTLVGVDGQWRPLAAGETPPADAPITTLQTVTLADVYVTRGEPTRTVVDAPIGTLAIRPITHPNQVLVASGFEVEVLFDGAPLANLALVLYASGDADHDLDTYVVTDEAGRATFTLPAAGAYIIAARHRANAPAGAEAEVRSYTTTVTFEAYDTLPETYNAAERDAERARDADRRRIPPARRRVGRPD